MKLWPASETSAKLPESEAGDGFDDDEQNGGEKRPLQNVRRSVMVAVVMQFIPLSSILPLSEPGDFGKVEAADLHGRDHHVESLFAGGADGRRKRFHVVQQFDDALIEAEIAQAPR